MSPKKILLVDDEPNNLRALKLDMEDTGYEIFTASDGLEAWEMLSLKPELNAILLDRMMPNMDGMEFIRRLKAHPDYSGIPVIMQTAAAEKDQVAEGIKAGVYYYLTKPYNKQIMLSVLAAAINDYTRFNELRESLRRFKNKLNLIRHSVFEVRTYEDTEYLSTFLAQFFPDPERVILGISELTINALEHGNLGITYDEKTQLNKSGIWREEITRREQLPENKHKVVVIDYTRYDQKIELRIRDEGSGFDWKRYLDISTERATHNHGRGIAMSRITSFDEMNYVGCGNEVICAVYLPEHIVQ